MQHCIKINSLTYEIHIRYDPLATYNSSCNEIFSHRKYTKLLLSKDPSFRFRVFIVQHRKHRGSSTEHVQCVIWFFYIAKNIELLIYTRSMRIQLLAQGNFSQFLPLIQKDPEFQAFMLLALHRVQQEKLPREKIMASSLLYLGALMAKII